VNKGIFVIGAGGHSKVVVSCLQERNISIAAILDDDESKWERRILGVPVRGPVAVLSGYKSVRAIPAIGDNDARLFMMNRFSNAIWITVVHPAAWVHKSVTLGAGTVIFAGAVVQPDTHIGLGCIVNTGATIDHDCFVGDGVHIAPGSNIAGGVKIGEGSFLGIGTKIIPNIKIGKEVVIGAGSVIIRDIPDLVTAVGVPARIIKTRGV